MATRSSAAPIVIRQTAPAPVVRRSSHSGSKKVEKAEKRLAALSRRARDISQETESAAITIATPALMGLIEANGTKLPSLGGFDPYLVIGAPLALLGGKIIGGRWGKRAAAAGVGCLTVAAHRASKAGSFKVEGDEIGGDEIGADDDDD